MPDEKFALDKNNIAIGMAAGAASAVLLSLAVPDTARQFGEEVKERYLGLRHRHKGRHSHHEGRPNASHADQATARREEQAIVPQR